MPKAITFFIINCCPLISKILSIKQKTLSLHVLIMKCVLQKWANEFMKVTYYSCNLIATVMI